MPAATSIYLTPGMLLDTSINLAYQDLRTIAQHTAYQNGTVSDALVRFCATALLQHMDRPEDPVASVELPWMVDRVRIWQALYKKERLSAVAWSYIWDMLKDHWGKTGEFVSPPHRLNWGLSITAAVLGYIPQAQNTALRRIYDLARADQYIGLLTPEDASDYQTRL